MQIQGKVQFCHEMGLWKFSFEGVILVSISSIWKFKAVLFMVFLVVRFSHQWFFVFRKVVSKLFYTVFYLFCSLASFSSYVVVFIYYAIITTFRKLHIVDQIIFLLLFRFVLNLKCIPKVFLRFKIFKYLRGWKYNFF